MTKLWYHLRPIIVRCKRWIFFEKPRGLKHLGSNSLVQRPRRLIGRKAIQIGDNSEIMSHGLLMAVTKYADKSYDPLISIGDGVYIGRYAYLTAAQEITISDNCVLSEHVYITDLNHGYDPAKGPIMSQDIECKGPVRIGSNCFLGYRTVIMPGVTLGPWCIVGANSVVTRSFSPYSMIAGAPAQLVKVYSHALGRWVTPEDIEKIGDHR